MEDIELKVTKTAISVTNQYILNQGEYNVDKCVFDFSDDYNDLIKKAVFVYNDEEPIQMVILENECNIPYELLQVANEFTLKVYAYEAQNDELVQRYSPTPLKIFLREGSYQGSNEVITPSQFEQYEAKLDEGLKEVDDKLEVVDETLETMNTAINEANTLNIDVSDKVNKDVTITLTRKDNTTKSVVVSDGDDFQYNWDGTKLGVKTDKEQSYTYIDLEGPQGPIGPQGEAFQIKKTYNTIQEMIADYNNMQVNDYVMISGSVEQQDNATLWVKTETEDPTYKWVYLADFSGASGIQGPTGATPNIQIGNVTSGDTPNVTRRGTDENPILDFTLVKGEQGIQGETGNGIDSIEKTSTSGLVDTYTITYDNGDTDTFDVTNGADGNVTDVQVDGTSVVDNGVANIEGINKLKQDIEMYKMLENALPKVEGEGETIHLEDTAKCPMKVGFKGQIQQDSTSISGGDEYDSPSPDHPQPIHIVSGDNEIKVCNKNLLPITSTGTFTHNGITFTTNADGSVKVQGTATANANAVLGANGYFSSSDLYASSGVAILNTNGQYYYSSSATTTRVIIVESDTPNYAVKLSYKQGSFTHTGTIRLTLRVDSGATVNETIYPMLELGSTATEYVGHQGYTKETNLGDLEVGGIGDYEDEFIKNTGKNLFDKDTSEAKKYVRKSDGTIQNSNDWSASDYILIKPNTTYIYSGITNGASGNAGTSFYDNNKVFISSINSTEQTFATPNNAKYVRISLNTETPTNVMLNEGSTALPYEPFGKDKWYLKKNIGKVVLDGSESAWIYQSEQQRFRLQWSIGANSSYLGFCNNYVVDHNLTNDYSINIQSNYGFIKDSRYTSTDDYKNWLSTHNTIVYYVLATPENILLNDTLQETLDSFYSWQEQTNISQENNDLPFVIKASAIKDISNL